MGTELANKIYNEFMGSDANSIASTLGIQAARAALSSKFPNDFEFYFMALELTDYKDNVIDYFVFPVMPKNYDHTDNSLINIRKTIGGVTVIGNSSFVPVPLSLSGNFGRKFSVMLGNDKVVRPAVAHYSTTTGVYDKEGMKKSGGSFKKMVMDSRIKSGYGAIKILQAICNKSKGEIDGMPMKLYLYNPAFNDNYLVKVNKSRYYQNVQENMIWNYEIQFTAVAPMDMTSDDAKGKMKSLMLSSVMSQALTNSAHKLISIANTYNNGYIDTLVSKERRK